MLLATTYSRIDFSVCEKKKARLKQADPGALTTDFRDLLAQKKIKRVLLN
jgi:hypothetical protein